MRCSRSDVLLYPLSQLRLSGVTANSHWGVLQLFNHLVRFRVERVRVFEPKKVALCVLTFSHEEALFDQEVDS